MTRNLAHAAAEAQHALNNGWQQPTPLTREQLDQLAVQYLNFHAVIPAAGDSKGWAEYRHARDQALDKARRMILADTGWLGGPYTLTDGDRP